MCSPDNKNANSKFANLTKSEFNVDDNDIPNDKNTVHNKLSNRNSVPLSKWKRNNNSNNNYSSLNNYSLNNNNIKNNNHNHNHNHNHNKHYKHSKHKNNKHSDNNTNDINITGILINITINKGSAKRNNSGGRSKKHKPARKIKIVSFNEIVKVIDTHGAHEYCRKYFRCKLHSTQKAEIKLEVLTYKIMEMPVHPSSVQNTNMHDHNRRKNYQKGRLGLLTLYKRLDYMEQLIDQMNTHEVSQVETFRSELARLSIAFENEFKQPFYVKGEYFNFDDNSDVSDSLSDNDEFEYEDQDDFVNELPFCCHQYGNCEHPSSL
eukprot:Pgem_evm1s2870